MARILILPVSLIRYAPPKASVPCRVKTGGADKHIFIETFVSLYFSVIVRIKNERKRGIVMT
jgi:hypothetical protein